MKMVCKLINFMRRSLGGHTLLYTYICLHDYDFGMDFFLFYFMLWWYYVVYGPLWSTYDRGRIWGNFIFHSTEAVWVMIALEEWLGCRHVVAHARHTRVNTSVGSIHIFSEFSYYKLICIMFYFKNYIYII